MNLWFAPQISEHCAYSRPGLLIENLIWFSWPGVAFDISPSLGAVHECNTSAAVMVIRIDEFIGSTTQLSVSSSQNVLVFSFYCCTMYEPNSSLVKFKYS